MTSSLGRLIQPLVSVTWGELTLSEWDYGDKHKRPVIFNVSLDLKSGNKQVNKASMEFDPSTVGFEAYVQCIGEENIKKPIIIKMGYEKGSFFETSFFFQNVDFVTGRDQRITVHLAGLQRNLLTSHWWNEYIGDGIQERDAKELISYVAQKAGMTAEFTPGAEKLIQGLPKIKKAGIVNQTIGNFLVALAEKYGLTLEYPTGSADDSKKIVVSTAAAVDEEQSTQGKPAGAQKIDMGSGRKGQRYGFVVGPTLATSIKRSTKPFGAKDKNADMSYDVKLKADDGEIDSKNAVEESRVLQGKKAPSGSTSSNEKVSLTECEGKAGEELAACRKKLREKAAKKAESEYSDCSVSVMMVPYMVGIRPYDFVLFPSLKGDYIEDWEVDSVSYKQDGAAVLVSVNGMRPQTGQGSLMVEGDLKKFQDKVGTLKTISDWHNYYWSLT